MMSMSVSQEISRDAGFALSEGRDSGFQSNMGRVSGLKVCTGCRMPKISIMQDYGIGRKFESGLQY